MAHERRSASWTEIEVPPASGFEIWSKGGQRTWLWWLEPTSKAAQREVQLRVLNEQIMSLTRQQAALVRQQQNLADQQQALVETMRRLSEQLQRVRETLEQSVK
jgi:hypothetical protein